MRQGVQELTTATIDISDDNQQESRWAVLTSSNGKLSHIGQVNKIIAAKVPDRCHEILSSPRSNALFLTSEGHWAKTLEAAADLLANSESLKEFIATGGLLGLFQLPRDEDCSKHWSDYRVFRDFDGCWSAEEITSNSCYINASGNQRKL
jgi:hypothetical protein